MGSRRWERKRPSTNPHFRQQDLNEPASGLPHVCSSLFANGDERNEESARQACAGFSKTKARNGRYVFVTVHTPAEKYATELYERLEKTNRTICP